MKLNKLSDFKYLGDTIGRMPRSVSLPLRHVGVRLNYLLWANRCKKGFKKYGHLYTYPTLLIIGIPKSGTNWMSRMLATYPGYGEHRIGVEPGSNIDVINGVNVYSNLSPNAFEQFENKLAVTKIHHFGTPNNLKIIHNYGLRYVVLYRDIRDIAVSVVHMLRRLSWEPAYPVYANLSIEDALITFAERMLPLYMNWIRSWSELRDPQNSIVLQYENMLSQPVESLTAAAKLFELDSSPEIINSILEQNSFKAYTKGRRQGQEGASHFRKGIAGDWKNYFTPTAKDVYKQILGDFLIEVGYETNNDW